MVLRRTGGAGAALDELSCFHGKGTAGTGSPGGQELSDRLQGQKPREEGPGASQGWDVPGATSQDLPHQGQGSAVGTAGGPTKQNSQLLPCSSSPKSDD